MKKIVLTLVLMLTVSFAFANRNIDYNTNIIKVTSSNQIELKLDLGDITNKSKNEIQKEVNSFFQNTLNSLDDELQCKVTVTGTVDVGVAKVEISVEVSGPCSEIRKAGSEIANQILDEIKKALK